MNGSFPIASYPDRERFGYFRALVDRAFCPMQVDSIRSVRERFEGQIDAVALSQMGLARVATSACTVRRRAEDVSRHASPLYLIKFQAHGQSVWTQRGCEIHLRPKDFVVCSTAEPYSLHFLGSYVMPVISLTPAVMRRLTPNPDQFLGRRFGAEEPDCGILSNFVADVASRLPLLDRTLCGRIEANIIDLLGAVLNARESHAGISTRERLTQVKAYIEQHLHDPKLSASAIAAVFGISPRHLHSVFAHEGTSVGHYIRRRRVRGCCEALGAGQGGQVSLSELALLWGFYDLSHMNRSFRAEVGVSPSELRAAAQTPCAFTS
jgi:AraC family transcriptional activator of tynA and feaB